MAARYGPLSNSIAAGETLVQEGHFGAPEVTERIQDIRAQWTHLEEVSVYHIFNLLQYEVTFSKYLFSVLHFHVFRTP